jgi:hydrogenase nickel incorporation protein HypB
MVPSAIPRSNPSDHSYKFIIHDLDSIFSAGLDESLTSFRLKVLRTTGTLSHLEAAMVQAALDDWDLCKIDFLFIENVGNLVRLSSYDLDENIRLVLMSVTEGEDNPLKYPTIFDSANVVVITKVDLADAVEFDSATANRSIQAVRPGMVVLSVSAKSGAGMDACLDFLQSRRPSTGSRGSTGKISRLNL